VCDHAYASGMRECPRCRTENPLEAERAVMASNAERVEDEPSPGSWASVYQIRRCDRGHAYSDRAGTKVCPRCRSGGMDFLKSSGKRLTADGSSDMIRM
jgi:hypothetical protein